MGEREGRAEAGREGGREGGVERGSEGEGSELQCREGRVIYVLRSCVAPACLCLQCERENSLRHSQHRCVCVYVCVCVCV